MLGLDPGKRSRMFLFKNHNGIIERANNQAFIHSNFVRVTTNSFMSIDRPINSKMGRFSNALQSIRCKWRHDRSNALLTLFSWFKALLSFQYKTQALFNTLQLFISESIMALLFSSLDKTVFYLAIKEELLSVKELHGSKLVIYFVTIYYSRFLSVVNIV